MQATSSALLCAHLFDHFGNGLCPSSLHIRKLFGHVRIDEDASTMSKVYQHWFQSQGLHWSCTLEDT